MQLLVNEGKHRGKFINVVGPRFLIGRDASCQLRPLCDEVSRHHAEIKLVGELVVLTDLGSRNGTRVNGHPIDGMVCLRHGDRIAIGPLEFTAMLDAEAAPRRRKARPELEDEVASWLSDGSDDEAESPWETLPSRSIRSVPPRKQPASGRGSASA